MPISTWRIVGMAWIGWAVGCTAPGSPISYPKGGVPDAKTSATISRLPNESSPKSPNESSSKPELVNAKVAPKLPPLPPRIQNPIQTVAFQESSQDIGPKSGASKEPAEKKLITLDEPRLLPFPKKFPPATPEPPVAKESPQGPELPKGNDPPKKPDNSDGKEAPKSKETPDKPKDSGEKGGLPNSAPSNAVLESILQKILARNPTLEQMRAVSQGLYQRFPQVTSLEDPMLGVAIAPGSIGARGINFASRFEVSQKIPSPLKRDLRGREAMVQAAASERDTDDTRLQLIETAKIAYTDLFLATKLMAINDENAKLLKEFRQNAETRYKTGQAPQQDLLQADVEIARQQEKGILLRRSQNIAKARLNTLMRESPDAELPPVDVLPNRAPLDTVQTIRQLAIQQRPDLQALRERLSGDEASLGLAMTSFQPDVEVLAAYDGFWQKDDRALQMQVGARFNLPFREERRYAAVAEARAKIRQRRAEIERLSDQIQLQVQEAWEMVREADEVVQLYDTKVLPAARASVRESRLSYVNGKVPFVALIESLRTLVTITERYQDVLADAYRRRVQLERVRGLEPGSLSKRIVCVE